jgi:hypothetical protein
VKYYRSKAAAEGSKTVASDLAAAGLSTEVQGQQVRTSSDVQSFASPPAAWLVMCVWGLMSRAGGGRPTYAEASEHQTAADGERRLRDQHLPDIRADPVHLPWVFVGRHRVTQPGIMVRR